MKNDNLFKDKELNYILEKDGIVKFTLPDKEIVSKCQQIIDNVAPPVSENFKHGFYAGVLINDVDFKKNMSAMFGKVLIPPFSKITENYRFMSFSYLAKGIGERTALDIHQDWSVTDERNYNSYNLWIPLSNSTKENGTLYALKGSHKFPLNIRGGGIPPKYMNHREKAIHAMEIYDVKLGEALIFDSRLVHYSPPNQTEKIRYAIVAPLISNKTQPIVYNGEIVADKLKVRAYRAPDDFYMNFTNFMEQKDKAPDFVEFIGEIDNPNTDEISEEEFLTLLKQVPKKKRFFWQQWL